MAFTLAKYRNMEPQYPSYRQPTSVSGYEADYNSAMDQAYQAGKAAQASYGHSSASGDNNARLQALYARQRELESRKAKIEGRIGEIDTQLQHSEQYKDDPLYKAARSKYIWEGDDTGLVNFRRMIDEQARTAETARLNEQMRRQSEESGKITLRNRAQGAYNTLQTLPETAEFDQQRVDAQATYDEAVQQLANMGEEFVPSKTGSTLVVGKTSQAAGSDAAGKGKDAGTVVESLDKIQKEWDALSKFPEKITKDAKAKFKARVERYQAKNPKNTDAGALLIKIENAKVFVPLDLDKTLAKANANEKLTAAERKLLHDKKYEWDRLKRQWVKKQ